MPIYAYKCSACEHAQDVLQKMSDPLLTTCPQCKRETYVKQVTAAGFQLKGSGWYVTDFRNNGKGTSSGDGAASASNSEPASTASSGASAPAPAAPAAPAAATPVAASSTAG